MRYRFHILDVFSHRTFGGNPLAVLPDATGLSAAGMQRVAREFNFPETTFVLPPTDARFTRRVRIFTPAAELAFAGHPTLGTACALLKGGHAGAGDAVDMILEEGVGAIHASIRRANGVLEGSFTLEARLEQPAGAPDAQALAEVLGLHARQVRAVFLAGIGLNFTFAHLVDNQAVDEAVLDLGAWSRHLAGSWAPQVFLFALDPADPSKAYARMFAPALGIAEDPATGSACGALAATLCAQGAEVGVSVVQGAAMGRRSDIQASARRTPEGLFVRIGGGCVAVADGEIEVPARWLEA